jgi:hypothetical protein
MESKAEYCIGDEGQTLEEFIANFPYVDVQELTDFYNEQKEYYGKEA